VLSCFCGWHADDEFGRRTAVGAVVWTPTTAAGFVIKRETADHLLVHCPTAREVCWNVFTWARCACTLGNDNDLREHWERLVAMQQPRRRKGASTLFMIVAWHLWKERNMRLFKQRTAITSVIIDRIKAEANLWVAAGAQKLGHLFCE
jgi:hypothetical protein